MKLKSKKTRTLLLTAVMACLTVTASATYQYGDKGGEITTIQKKLISAGYKARVTGEYDANTKWAVRLFQKDKGLAVDGILGPATYKKLMGKTMSTKSTKATAKAKVIAKKATTNAAAASKISRAVTETSPVEYSGLSAHVPEMIQYAHRFQGVPYVFGGTTPDGFDCSGYTRYVFEKIGVDLPRSADEQYMVGKKVSRMNLKPGDLVFFETYEPGPSHSGIYIGGDKFISATSSRGVAVASLSDDYWGPRYLGAKRVL